MDAGTITINEGTWENAFSDVTSLKADVDGLVDMITPVQTSAMDVNTETDR